MSAVFLPGVRYRMPAVFGPAPGPRQKADGTPWRPEESGTVNCSWCTVTYRTSRLKLEKLLPPGFELRGEPAVSVSLAFFKNVYWLAGRGYGIVFVEFPATYSGRTESLSGSFCPVLWEGLPDAVLTGREELGFPKLFADIPDLDIEGDRSVARGKASWFEHTFFDMHLKGLKEAGGEKKLPGPGGAQMWFKYLPRTGRGGGHGPDVAYVTTSAPPPEEKGSASPIRFEDSNFRRWSADSGSVQWHRATFEQLPTTFHVVNALADLEILEYVSAEKIEFSAPGTAVSASGIRAVESA